MKKTVYTFLTLFMISALFISCVPEEETELSVPVKSDTQSVSNEEEPYIDDTTQYHSYQEPKIYTNNGFMFITDTPAEFKEYLYSNQIDADMKHEDETSGIYTTGDILAFYQKYFDLWGNEMNSVYEDLLAELEGEARELLRESQESWEITNHNDSNLWHHIFSVTKGRGSLDSAFIAPQTIDNIRRRTFLLAEYYFWLTGDFKFSYDKPDENLADWQETYINYFENFDFNTIDSIYIGDINGDDVPEVIINGGILYYSDGRIKGDIGNATTSFHWYLPETNQILVTCFDMYDSDYTFYTFNADTSEYELSDEYVSILTKHNGLWLRNYTLNGVEFDITEEAFDEMYENWIASALLPQYLTLDDIDGDFTSYIDENLFY